MNCVPDNGSLFPLAAYKGQSRAAQCSGARSIFKARLLCPNLTNAMHFLSYFLCSRPPFIFSGLYLAELYVSL